ncbi:MAG: hypothetical protein WBH31_09100 [Promethearchaeia archaeon]
MEILKVNSEELVRYPVKNFIGKGTFNNKSSGTGKTWKSYEIIDYGIEHQMLMMICLPTHDNIKEFIKRMNNHRDNAIQLKGKMKYCKLRNKVNAYLIGCTTCKHQRKCRYIKQFSIAKDKQIIFIVPHHLHLVREFNPDILIIDESIEKQAHKGIKIPERVNPNNYLVQANCNTCPFSNKCSDQRKRFKRNHGCYFTLYKTLNLDDFEPESLEEYFFKYNYENLDNIFAVEDNSRNHVIIGDTPLDFLNQVNTLIFNCATTRISIAEKIFQRKFDIVILDEEKLENRIFLLDDLMTKKKTKVELTNAEKYFEVLNIPLGDKTLIYTKKEFEEYFKKKFPKVKTGHYGDSRGYNKFEECENVIIFGRYGLTPAVQMLLELRGYKSREIHWFEKAEELQAMHRIRPIRDKNKMIYLLSNSLKEVVEPTDYINLNSLKIGFEILNGDYEGMTKTEIYEKVKGNIKDKIRAIDTLQNTGKIGDMTGRGKKLQKI